MFILRYPAYVCGLLRVKISTLYKRQVKYRGAWIVHHYSLIVWWTIHAPQIIKCEQYTEWFWWTTPKVGNNLYDWANVIS